jgi:hypothetical protein
LIVACSDWDLQASTVVLLLVSHVLASYLATLFYWSGSLSPPCPDFSVVTVLLPCATRPDLQCLQHDWQHWASPLYFGIAAVPHCCHDHAMTSSRTRFIFATLVSTLSLAILACARTCSCTCWHHGNRQCIHQHANYCGFCCCFELRCLHSPVCNEAHSLCVSALGQTYIETFVEARIAVQRGSTL